MDRRKLILGGACLIAAPAIVRYSSLMPIKVFRPDDVWICEYEKKIWPGIQQWRLEQTQLAIRGLDAEAELRNILRSEVQKEVNQEVIKLLNEGICGQIGPDGGWIGKV